MATKKCLRCKEEKPLDAFGKYAKMRDGHSYYCKACALAACKLSRDKNKAEAADSADDMGILTRIKKCSKCGVAKMMYCFSKCSQTKDGRFSRCKDCEKERRESRKC